MKKVTDIDKSEKISEYVDIELNSFDTIKMMTECMEEHPDWVPGVSKMSEKDHEQVMKNLREL